MSTDAKPSPSSSTPSGHVVHREKGMRIFVWPKVIFLYPTAIVALICWAGMWMNHDRTHDPTRPLKDAMKNIAEEDKTVGGQPADSTGKVSHFKTPHEEVTIVSTAPADSTHKVDRFKTPQNLLAMLFLGMFAFNLLIMALDFPRFTLVAWILAIFPISVYRPVDRLIFRGGSDKANSRDLLEHLRGSQSRVLPDGLRDIVHRLRDHLRHPMA